MPNSCSDMSQITGIEPAQKPSRINFLGEFCNVTDNFIRLGCNSISNSPTANALSSGIFSQRKTADTYSFQFVSSLKVMKVMNSGLNTTLRKVKNRLKQAGQQFLIHFKDLKNKIRYGIHAPKYMERIWVDPRIFTRIISRLVISA